VRNLLECDHFITMKSVNDSVAVSEFLHTIAEMVRMKAWLSFRTYDAAKCEDIRRA
jgi:hypothetical protein